MAEQKKRGASRRLPRGTPAVVFLDDWEWNAFHQLTSPLRRAGVRTIRVSTARLRRTRVSAWLLFDRYEILPGDFELAQLKEILDGENIVDIQYSESLAEPLQGVVDSLTFDLAQRLGRRLNMVDKLAASKRFAAAGVRTPRAVPVSEISAQEVATAFEFPIVVKPKVGCGGAHVTIAHDLVDLVAATSGSDREDLYYEEFVAGTKLDYAAAVSVTGIEQEIAYRILQWEQPVGRATEVQTVEDPQLVDFGRKVIAAAGCTGLVNMDVIRDAQGCDWLIDFNPRAFGASCNFRAAGIDISQGYLRAIGQRTTPPTRRTPIVGTSITIFPTTLDDLIQSGSVVRTAVAFMRQSVPFLRWLGWRYWLSEGLMTAMAVSSARSKRARLVHATAEARLDTVPS